MEKNTLSAILNAIIIANDGDMTKVIEINLANGHIYRLTPEDIFFEDIYMRARIFDTAMHYADKQEIYIPYDAVMEIKNTKTKANDFKEKH